LLLLLDQLGVRRLSGEDFPPTDPLAGDLRRHVDRLASVEWAGRKPGTPGNDEAARYLAGELEKAGLLPLPSLGGYLAPLGVADVGGAELGHNVIGYLPASEASSPRAPGSPAELDLDLNGAIVLGAHFDHIGPTREGVLLGADDNASSVAVLLGAVTSLRNERRARPVLVAFFNTEEPPYFLTPRQGSRRFLAALPRELSSARSIHLAVVLDLIGGVVWRPFATTLFACGAEASPGLGALVDRVREDGLSVRRLGIHMVENLPGRSPQPFSDYDAFRLARVPYVFLSSGRTPRYHTPADLPATLHYDRMARTSRWIARLVAAAGDLNAPLDFDPAATDLAADRDTMRWALEEASSPWRSVPGTGPITAARLLGDLSRVRAMSEPGHALTGDDAIALERASFRLQCLLYAYPVCFTL
jgi:hypothetical protein